ncbi:MAG TPA: response regulator [Thermoanaerobaculia bacterium]|nr:response regulator [Thermoanaerobaculia bacterium]
MTTPTQLRKILIVEDSELLQRMYEVVFRQRRQNGCSLLRALNGREALQRLSEHPDTDLILLDINMPVMSGMEFLAHCKREQVFHDIPVIIVSTEGKHEDTVRALRGGARGYVTKPFKPHDLHTLIDRIFDAGRTQRAPALEQAGSVI